MLQIGTKQQLQIVKLLGFGAYLSEHGGEKEEEVLLPAKEVPADAKKGDRLTVFLYMDSEDRLIATVREPLIRLHEVRKLRIRQVTKVGAFADWGLEKDLLLPYAEQTKKVQAEEEVLCALYTDKSGRLCLTMNVYPYLENRAPYGKDAEVSGTVYEKSDNFGLFVAVDDRYSALIPRQELYGKVPAIGESVTARVKEVHPDGRLVLALRKKAYLQMEDDAETLLSYMEAHGGDMPYGDKSSAEEIKEAFGMSKAAFKRALGRLYKDGKVELAPSVTTLLQD